MRIARRLGDIQPFHVMAILERARAMEQAGADIVHMEIGEPDFPTPRGIVEAAARFIERSVVKYTPAAGLPELREAIAGWYQRRYGVEVPARRIFVTPGASGAFLLALGLLIEPGDAVLLADPGYPCYANFVRLFEGRPVGVSVGVASAYQLNAELLRAPAYDRASGVIVATPSNPTGTHVDAGALEEMIAMTEQRGGFFIADEIYHGLEYGEPARTALALSDQVFVINSFSKYFGMTGWRLGWLVAPGSCVEPLERLAQNVFIAASTVSQATALAAFENSTLAELEARRREFEARRDYLMHALPGLGFEIPVRPDGAFYIYADSRRLARDSFAFAQMLLTEGGVAVTPGRDFGRNAPESHVRFSYTASIERLGEGVARMRDVLQRRELGAFNN
jgi:aspartate/methionine/tyrosine aminotransferase